MNDNKPPFLTLEHVLDINKRVPFLEAEYHQVRDQAALESAVFMPEQGYGGQYFCQDAFEMAATYMFHISQSQAFMCGNKRTGLTAALEFLARCGIVIVVTEQKQLVDLSLDMANGKVDKVAAAEFFRRNYIDIDELERSV